MLTNVISFQALLGCSFPKWPEQFSVMVFDPLEPTVIAPDRIWPLLDGALSPQDFRELSQRIVRFRKWAMAWVENGGIIVVLLRPYSNIRHSHYPELKIGNYDWLWPEAGRNLKLCLRCIQDTNTISKELLNIIYEKKKLFSTTIENKTQSNIEKTVNANIVAIENIVAADTEKKSADANIVATENVVVAADSEKPADANIVATEKVVVATDSEKPADADIVATEKVVVAVDVEKSVDTNIVATEKVVVANTEKKSQEDSLSAAINISALKISRLGELTPFFEYLTQAKLRLDVWGEGAWEPLATLTEEQMTSQPNLLQKKTPKVIAGILQHGKGKIIFLPNHHGSSQDQQLLETALELAANTESWPKFESVSRLQPMWLKNIGFPELDNLSESVATNHNQISQLQQQIISLQKQVQALQTDCGTIQEKIIDIRKLQSQIFCGSNNDLLLALAQLFQNSGLQVAQDNDCLRIHSTSGNLVLLPVVSNQEATLWWGSQLLRQIKSGEKGLFVLNTYRHLSPSERPQLYSSALLEFVNKHSLSMISLDTLLSWIQSGSSAIEQLFIKQGLLA